MVNNKVGRALEIFINLISAHPSHQIRTPPRRKSLGPARLLAPQLVGLRRGPPVSFSPRPPRGTWARLMAENGSSCKVETHGRVAV